MSAGVRRAGPGDVASIAEIERLSFPEPWSEPAWRAEVEHPGALVLVVESPAEGFASFRRMSGEAELLRVAVHPAARRKGWASRLLEAGLASLRGEEAAICHLEVRANNQAAITLYLRYGFVEVGRRPRYYTDGTDALLFTLAL